MTVFSCNAGIAMASVMVARVVPFAVSRSAIYIVKSMGASTPPMGLQILLGPDKYQLSSISLEHIFQ